MYKTSRFVFYPPHIIPPDFTALSKTQIPKVMFLGAVAPPNEAKNFDGRIGLWEVTEEKVALRRSKFHDRDDIYDIPTIMNGDKFLEMCKEKLIPAIKKKLSFAKLVEVQIDSAGGHKVNTTVDELNNYCKSFRKPQIQFITQPTRSPDLNVLDLGIWNSLQSLVPTVKYQEDAEVQMHQRIINEVKRAWNEYDSTKLTKIFNTLKLVYSEVSKVQGGNNYKPPHARKFI